MLDKLREVSRQEVFPSEACLAALFWNDPVLYGLNTEDKISSRTFNNPIWGFFFGLGRQMYDRKLAVFDDIGTMRTVNELGVQDMFNDYGGYTTISELMEENKESKDNFDGYYNDVKKHFLLRRLSELLGPQVYVKSGNYDYHRMSTDLLSIYWSDKLNNIVMENDNAFDEGYLLAGLRDKIHEWDTMPSIGLPFYKSKLMTDITTGWDYGHVYINGGFGGKGKTSFTINKIVMSCIESKEKLLIIANEQSLDEWQKLLLVTTWGTGTNRSMQRQRLQKGQFSEKEREKLDDAVAWLEELIDDDRQIILIFMESYTMDNVKKVLTHYAHRGYRRVVIDTAKPGDNADNISRWERFAEDMKDLYKIARQDAGGLNLALWVNVQLADTAAKQRFLTEHALADSKKIKNEASVLFLSRPVWDDEYEGDDKRALKVYRWGKNEFTDEWCQIESTLPKYEYDAEGKIKHKNIYYLLFTGKNRRGQSNDTGLDVLVMEVNLNNNTWKEIGWTHVINENKYY